MKTIFYVNVSHILAKQNSYMDVNKEISDYIKFYRETYLKGLSSVVFVLPSGEDNVIQLDNF